jgi:glycosyltransferase involved in cell wall biosynthesis
MRSDVQHTQDDVVPHPVTPPLVSVVIPTLGRPDLLLRALNSVFNQTYKKIEIIVVVDGPDDRTIEGLGKIVDARLHVIINSRSLTAAGARNIGASHAKGEWIAFLDDDDEWLPNKIARQLEFASDRGDIFVSCFSRIVSQTSIKIRPDTIYDNLMPLDEYLFDRRSFFTEGGFIQTSSYFMLKELFDKVRFRVDNPHDDWDFVLRISKVWKVRIETVPEVLVIIHVDEERPSLSRSGSWLASLEWVDNIRPMITRRAYSGFCLGVVSLRAAKEGSIKEFFLVLCRAFKYGSPRILQICIFLSIWLLPTLFLRRLRARIAYLRRDFAASLA